MRVQRLLEILVLEKQMVITLCLWIQTMLLLDFA